MQPAPSPRLDIYKTLKARVIDRVSTVIPKQTSTYFPTATAVPSSVVMAWRTVPTAFDEIDAELIALGEAIFAATTNQVLVDSAKSQRIAAAADQARSLVRP